MQVQALERIPDSGNSGSVPHLVGGDNMASGAERCRLGEHLFLEWGWVLVYQQ